MKPRLRRSSEQTAVFPAGLTSDTDSTDTVGSRKTRRIVPAPVVVTGVPWTRSESSILAGSRRWRRNWELHGNKTASSRENL